MGDRSPTRGFLVTGSGEVYLGYRKEDFAKKVKAPRGRVKSLHPYHYEALRLTLCLPYTDGLSRDRAYEAAGKIADQQADYIKSERISYTLHNNPLHPATTQVVNMNLQLMRTSAYECLHKLVSSHAVNFL